MTAWAQGADFVWIGTTTHQMVFTLLAEAGIAKGADLKGKKIGITRLGSASDLAVRAALEQFGLSAKDITMIALGGIPEILSRHARRGDPTPASYRPRHRPRPAISGYRPLLHIPDLGRSLPFPASPQSDPSFRASRKSRAPTWLRSPTAPRFTKKTAAPRCGCLRKYMRAEDRILESGYKEYDKAISSPPSPGSQRPETVKQPARLDAAAQTSRSRKNSSTIASSKPDSLLLTKSRPGGG